MLGKAEDKKSASKPADTDAGDPGLKLSIVVPVYNEELILKEAAEALLDRTRELGIPFELIFAENGSRDKTLSILAELQAKHPEIRYLSCGEPNYGLALKKGIQLATGEFVICEEIDLCDSAFHREAISKMKSGGAEMVIGSKLAKGSKDDRPLTRHAATIVINLMLRVMLGFKGTDTHGLKAFRRENLLSVVEACRVDRDLFASEFVIRAERMKRRIVEVPIDLQEKRKPSIHLLKRVPNVMKNMFKLFYIIRVKG